MHRHTAAMPTAVGIAAALVANTAVESLIAWRRRFSPNIAVSRAYQGCVAVGLGDRDDSVCVWTGTRREWGPVKRALQEAGSDGRGLLLSSRRLRSSVEGVCPPPGPSKDRGPRAWIARSDSVPSPKVGGDTSARCLGPVAGRSRGRRRRSFLSQECNHDNADRRDEPSFSSAKRPSDRCSHARILSRPRLTKPHQNRDLGLSSFCPFVGSTGREPSTRDGLTGAQDQSRPR
jgi:hypothetical protein